MAFKVGINECKYLASEMEKCVKELTMLASNLDNNTNLLRSALGDHYAPINRVINVISNELAEAGSNVSVLNEKMLDYITRVNNIVVDLQ